ncbi:TetR/AcrR family transcriptional regulator [Amycolatopsis saalfeldensis]|uniref:Regulatory protein, tetR family n=1 Tax=Amycolatopsis saalfeldensis TaxID=394193 RepID=A0A1H8U085_9PSEU|nr:TetR family transcriptional regulator [Amycolatopsis saalfeldensis]SEO96670.1 regulatory protein, tetR family [Amycolatopsis saalfeldensis]
MPNVSTAQRRAMLVDAAVQVIGEAGVGAATTRRIADRAGAPLATVHYCFRRKEDLYLEVFRKLSDEFARAAAEVEGADLEAVACGYLRATVAWMLARTRPPQPRSSTSCAACRRTWSQVRATA